MPKEQELRRREEMLVAEVAALFGEEEADVLEMVEAGDIDLADYYQGRESVWTDRLKKAIVGTAVISFLLDMSRLFGGESEPPDGYNLEARLAAQAYAESYAPNTARDIIGTSREFVSATVADLLAEEITFDELVAQLRESGLSAGRARQIAITETTRADYTASESLARYLQNEGFEVVRYWRTVGDDRVCPICEPLNGLPETPQGGWDPSGVGPGATPDAHIGCRCTIVPVIND